MLPLPPVSSPDLILVLTAIGLFFGSSSTVLFIDRAPPFVKLIVCEINLVRQLQFSPKHLPGSGSAPLSIQQADNYFPLLTFNVGVNIKMPHHIFTVESGQSKYQHL